MWNIKLYCDMDSVLVDFVEGARVVSNGKINSKTLHLLEKPEIWDLLYKKEYNFWEVLNWMDKGDILWSLIERFDPYILTAYPYSHGVLPHHKEYAMIGKLNWIKENIGERFVKRTYICAPEEKRIFAKGNVLIDDMEKNIKEWEEAGGKGFLYKSFDENIEEIMDFLEGDFSEVNNLYKRTGTE